MAAQMDSRTCRICGKSGDYETYQIREMMIGLRTEFEYFQCEDCGCLQIAELPSDMHPYYGDGYYSFADNPDNRNALVQAMYNFRTRYYLEGRGILGRFLTYKFPVPPKNRFRLKDADHVR